MKKSLLQILLLFIPVLTFAQENPPLFKDFAKGVKALTQGFALNDHVSILQVNTDNENFDLIAIDNNMGIQWKTSLKGYALVCSKFKGKILAISATEYSMFKGVGSTYEGYVLDPQNGKVLTDKIIYKGSNEMEDPSFEVGENGASFTLAIRQSNVERKVRIGLPSIFSFATILKLSNEYETTKSLTVLRLNEKLDPEFTFKPAVPDGQFIGIRSNDNGDIFVAWYNKPGIFSLIKYNSDSSTPSVQLDQEVSVRNSTGNVLVRPSRSDPSVVYLATVYKAQDRDIQLSLIKYDFGSKTKQTVDEVFDRDHVRTLEKSIERVNKDLHKPDLGSARNLDVQTLSEESGKLIVGISGTSAFYSAAEKVTWCNQGQILLNVYDLNLKPQFQQILPTESSYPNQFLPVGFSVGKGALRVVANNKSGFTTMNSVYGELNLENGKWNKINVLSKKKIDNAGYSNGGIWYADNYVVPYLERRGLLANKFNIILQQNNY